MMLVLTGMPYSPWSEKARWALDHHRIDYQREPYSPLLGEIKLRIRMRKPTGRVTVPVLYDGHTWFTDSFEIARHAEKIGSGSPLFPSDKLAEVAEWNRRSETAMAAGRAIRILASADDPRLALAALPPGVPAALKPLLLPLARKGVDVFIAKYRMRDGESSHKAVFTGELDALSKALSGRRYLLGDAFSYADIAMALAVQAVSPVDERYMPRIPGLEAGADGDELTRRYADLVEWRDELYAKHRRATASA
jgi:glutathione S-transferase